MNTKYVKNEDFYKIEKGDNIILLYENKEDMISSSAAFIQSSLQRNEKCLYIEGDLSRERLIAKLSKHITQINKYLKTAQLQILSREETYAISNRFQAERMINLLKKESLKALEKNWSGIAVTGELSWALNFADSREEIIEYEWKLNKYFLDNYPASAMSRYNINNFDSSVIKSLIELHPYLIWKGNIHENPYYIPAEGYKENKVMEYEIKSWLENIQKYKKHKSKFKDKLKNENEKYSFLFNKINDAVYLHKIGEDNQFGNFIKVNDAASEMLGYSREELLQMSPKDIDSPRVRERSHQKLLEQIKKTNEITIETEHLTAYGEIIPIELNINYYRQQGSSYLLSIARDISQKKKKEEKLITMKDNLQNKNENLEANNEKIIAINETQESSLAEINELNQRFLKLIKLFSNNEHLSTGDEDKFLKDMLDTAIKVIPEADYGSVYKYQNGKVNFVSTKGFNLNKIKNLDLPAESFYNINDDIEIIRYDKIETRNNRLMGHENYQNLNQMQQIKEILRLDLKMFGNKKLGLNLDIDKRSEQVFDDNSLKIFQAFQNIMASFYKVKEYNNLQNSFTKELITSIIKLLEMHDLYTKGHSENVADLASKIAKKMGLSDKLVDDTYWAGLVHDIGKLLVPLEVLNKKGKLSDEEYELIKGHPVLGSAALESSNSLKHIARNVKFHHERWDGKGYPYGFAQKEIPLVSQILQVADSWDAMRSDRSYRAALTLEEAAAELKKYRGTQFSPKVVDAFLTILA